MARCHTFTILSLSNPALDLEPSSRSRTQLSLSNPAISLSIYWSRSSSILSHLKTVPEVSAFGNVDVLGKIDPLSDSGASKTAATLHAVSILLKLGRSWNWFIELSALDYPLITQDNMWFICGLRSFVLRYLLSIVVMFGLWWPVLIALTLSFLRLWSEKKPKWAIRFCSCLVVTWMMCV